MNHLITSEWEKYFWDRGFSFRFFVYFCSENKNNQTILKATMFMKKFLFSAVAALFIGLTFTSCSKEQLIESINTVSYDFIVHSDEWKVDPASQDLTSSWEWPFIDNVLVEGNVMVYLYEGSRQVPLPYVMRWNYINPSTGLVDQVPVNIRFDIEPGNSGNPGIITFVVSDLSEYRLSAADLANISDGPLTFRVVCTYPVLYKV